MSDHFTRQNAQRLINELQKITERMEMRGRIGLRAIKALSAMHGKVINKRIESVILKEFPDYHVYYEKGNGRFGQYHVALWKDSYNDQIRLFLGYAEGGGILDINFIKEHNRFTDPDDETRKEGIREMMKALPALVDEWNKGIAILEEVHGKAKQLDEKANVYLHGFFPEPH